MMTDIENVAMRASLCCVALALCALATGACTIGHYQGWLLVNRREHPLELTMRRTEQCLDGDNLSDETAFGPPQRLRIRAQDKIWLTDHRFSGNGTDPRCGAVWISAEGEFDLVLAWDEEPEWGEDDDSTPYSLVVEGPRDAWVLHVPDEIEQLPPPGAKLLWVPPP